MASNKNQHFVPKVYLRQFSVDGEKKSINIFNFKRRKFIPRASIKNQCSLSYFYGRNDNLEKVIQLTEQSYGRIVQTLSDPNSKLSKEMEEDLKVFLLLQHVRTEARIRDAASRMMETVDVGFDGNVPPKFQMSVKEAVDVTMQNFPRYLDAIDDLKVRLVRNLSAIEFVTSDDPVVHTNRLHIQRKLMQHHTPGLNNAGLILLMPLNPRCLVLAYDGDVYTSHHTSGWIDVTREDDVRRLNEHQYLNCDANIYFVDWASREGIAADFDCASNRRPPSRYRINVAVFDKETIDGKRYKVVPREDAAGKASLIHVQSVMAEPSGWPSVLRFRNDARCYSNNSAVGYVRARTLEREGTLGGGYTKVRL